MLITGWTPLRRQLEGQIELVCKGTDAFKDLEMADEALSELPRQNFVGLHVEIELEVYPVILVEMHRGVAAVVLAHHGHRGESDRVTGRFSMKRAS